MTERYPMYIHTIIMYLQDSLSKTIELDNSIKILYKDLRDRDLVPFSSNYIQKSMLKILVTDFDIIHYLLILMLTERYKTLGYVYWKFDDYIYNHNCLSKDEMKLIYDNIDFKKYLHNNTDTLDYLIIDKAMFYVLLLHYFTKNKLPYKFAWRSSESIREAIGRIKSYKVIVARTRRMRAGIVK